MLLENIYKGKIFPQESIKSETKQYKELSNKRMKLYNQLNVFLSDENSALFDEYTEVLFGICEEQAMAAFVYGIKFGMKLNEETK